MFILADTASQGGFAIPQQVVSSGTRNGLSAYRSGLTAVDKLAVPTLGTPTAVTEAGSTLPNSALNISAAAANRWGVTTAAGNQTITPSANQAVRLPITQVPHAEAYDIFISTDANPKWVGRLTEAQRASGGFIISAVGVVSAGGGAGAGAVDLGIVGTGIASNGTQYGQNTAYDLVGVPAINCNGWATLFVYAKWNGFDGLAAPASAAILVFEIPTGTPAGDAYQISGTTFVPVGAARQSQEQRITSVTVSGTAAAYILLDVVPTGGQNPSLDLLIDLA